MRSWTNAATVDRTRPVDARAVLGRRAAIAISAALGLFLIWGVGFAGPQGLHDVAHDSRHSIAFPCH